MKKSIKGWSISTIAAFLLATWFVFLTSRCQQSMREAQNAIPPPLPDDYVGALVFLILIAASGFFGLLFLVSFLVLFILLIKDKFFSTNSRNE